MREDKAAEVIRFLRGLEHIEDVLVTLTPPWTREELEFLIEEEPDVTEEVAWDKSTTKAVLESTLNRINQRGQFKEALREESVQEDGSPALRAMKEHLTKRITGEEDPKDALIEALIQYIADTKDPKTASLSEANKRLAY